MNNVGCKYEIFQFQISKNLTAWDFTYKMIIILFLNNFMLNVSIFISVITSPLSSRGGGERERGGHENGLKTANQIISFL